MRQGCALNTCIVTHCEIQKDVYQLIFLFLFHKYALTKQARSQLQSLINIYLNLGLFPMKLMMQFKAPVATCMRSPRTSRPCDVFWCLSRFLGVFVSSFASFSWRQWTLDSNLILFIMLNTGIWWVTWDGYLPCQINIGVVKWRPESRCSFSCSYRSFP